MREKQKLKNLLHYKHDLFISLETCKDHLIEENIIKKERLCLKCKSKSDLVVYKEGNKKRLIYRCRKKNCQTKESVFKHKRVLFDEFCFIIYLVLIRESYNQIKLLCGSSNNKLTSVKNILRKYFELMNSKALLIGGPNVKVEVDETVLCRRGIIRDPTSADDNIKDTVWILGIIDTSNNNFYVTRVKDRTIHTITETLEGRIGVGSVLASDGFPSYPAVARNLSLNHIVVNHSEGFITAEGTHTNNIEALWSCMKSEMSREHGVKREDIDFWIEEFMFRRRFIDESSPECVRDVLYDIIKHLVNYFMQCFLKEYPFGFYIG